MARVVDCTITMRLIEGEHFNPFDLPIEDATALAIARQQFLDTINQLDNAGDLEEYVQCKIVEDVS